MLYYLHEKISTSGKEHPGPLPRPMAVLYSCFVVCFHGRIIRIGGERERRGFDNVPSFILSSSCIIYEYLCICEHFLIKNFTILSIWSLNRRSPEFLKLDLKLFVGLKLYFISTKLIFEKNANV